MVERQEAPAAELEAAKHLNDMINKKHQERLSQQAFEQLPCWVWEHGKGVLVLLLLFHINNRSTKCRYAFRGRHGALAAELEEKKHLNDVINKNIQERRSRRAFKQLPYGVWEHGKGVLVLLPLFHINNRRKRQIH